jgi:hypothetical protein
LWVVRLSSKQFCGIVIVKYVIDRLSCYSIAYYISSSYGDG